jgi:hypothetical protein
MARSQQTMGSYINATVAPRHASPYRRYLGTWRLCLGLLTG